MKVLVCGSRRFADPFRVSLAIDARMRALPKRAAVIHGAAQGADRIAAEAAHRCGHTVKSFPADWKTYGKRAGFVRNREMLDQHPDLVIAFWDGQSRGTAHTINTAKARGIPVEVIAS
ncbi:MAG TPA: SLOG family protein [Gaiellaceae bacterium]|nr:SLOG family protein [Gaiellaceae bacterium]